MYRLPSIIVLFALAWGLPAQSPHGKDFKMDCATCHSPDGWEIPPTAWEGNVLVIPEGQTKKDRPVFNHQETAFPLTGQHTAVDCRICHEELEFSRANSGCISCHTDLHQMTVGDDCARCHTTDHWLVDDVMQLHLENGFPLLGEHAVTSCYDCHTAETHVRFDRIGNDCINCHLDEYAATTSPDHATSGFSTDCMDCHDPASQDWFWTSGAANHSFFPLTGGHEINDCTQCHSSGNFSDTPTDCFACHQDDYTATTDPSHEAAGFPTDCILCHSTDPGWMANDFTQHDQLYFPIFSGKHRGEWNECTDCHTVSGNFTSFSCIDCHEHNDPADLADEHDEVGDYQYDSKACYSCHPRGDE